MPHRAPSQASAPVVGAPGEVASPEGPAFPGRPADVAFLSRLPVGVYVYRTDAEGHASFDYLSPTAGRLLGVDPEAVVRDVSRAFENAHPDDVASLGRSPFDESGVPRPFRWEGRYVVDGDIRWIRLEGDPEPVGDGGAIWRGIVQDVTAQRSTEDALAASEAMFRAAFEENADSIAVFRPVLDPDGRLVDVELRFANRVARDRYVGGTDSDDVVGRRYFELLPDARPLFYAEYARVAESGETVRMQLHGTRGDGEFWSDISLFPFAGGFVHVSRDVTEEQKALAAQREAAELQRRIFDTLLHGIIVLDRAGRIVDANPAAAAILGLDRDAVIAGDVANSAWQVHRDDGTPFPSSEHPVAVTLRTGLPCRDVVMRTETPDGRSFWVRSNTEALRDASGEVTGVVASFSDITTERVLAERLRQAERLEAVGQLAGGIAHDFNNLLAAIQGYAEMVAGEVDASSAARADIAEVLRAAEQAAGLTRQLLAFSRRQVLAPEVVDPSTIVDRVAPMLRRLVGSHIAIATSRGADVGNIRVDPGQLEQVIVNLALNARDAMPDGGRLTISLAHVPPMALAGAEQAPRSGPEGAAGMVRLTVEDTGCGMDAATLARIYEPFFTTKEPGKGSGMGLATVYGIVGASGGTIAVASEPGRGTAFTIDLPRVDEKADAAEPEAEAPVPRGSETVLLVEDQAPVRIALARMLRGLGYTVREAASGFGAIEAAGTPDTPLDILVTDVQMPGIQGPELARRLRAVRPGLPVLLISGYAEDLVSGAVDASGSISVLAKPFDSATFGRAVRATLDTPH